MKRWFKYGVVILVASLLAVPALAKSPLLLKHEAEMAVYDQQMVILKAGAEAARKAREAAQKRQGHLSNVFINLIPPVFVVNLAKAAHDGLVTKTDSPFEYLLVPRLCRALNAVKNTALDSTVMALPQLACPDRDITPEPGGQLGFLTARGVERGPIAQMIETGATVAPPVCAATGVFAPFIDVSQAGTVAIVTTIGGVGGIPVAEAAGATEKP